MWLCADAEDRLFADSLISVCFFSITISVTGVLRVRDNNAMQSLKCIASLLLRHASVV